MKTFSSILAIVALATTTFANPLPEADAGAALEKRADQYITYWTDTGFKGTKGQIKNPGQFQCYDLSSPFQDTISSAGPTSGLVCTFWENYGCKGASVTIRNPGVSDFRTVNFNDRTSAIQCAPS